MLGYFLVLPKDDKTRKRDPMISRVSAACVRLINIISVVKADAVVTLQMEIDNGLAFLCVIEEG